MGCSVGGQMEERRNCDAKFISFMATAEEKLSSIHNDIIELKGRVGIQNGRIFKLEKWQAFIFGGCALMGVIMTVASVYSQYLMYIKK